MLFEGALALNSDTFGDNSCDSWSFGLASGDTLLGVVNGDISTLLLWFGEASLVIVLAEFIRFKLGINSSFRDSSILVRATCPFPSETDTIVSL